MTASDTAVGLARLAAQAAADKNATDIAIIDVSERLPLTDCFVVVSGSNERQIAAIVDEVVEKLRLAGVKPLRREGERDGRWVLIDFTEIVVHIQHSEERVFYALDKLWGDCPTIPFTDAALGGAAPDDARGDAGEGAREDAGHDAGGAR